MTNDELLDAIVNAHSGAMGAAVSENRDDYRMYESAFYVGIARMRHRGAHTQEGAPKFGREDTER